MATRAIRTGLDPVDLESDYTKYNFGIRDLWSGLVPKYEGSPLQAQGISLEAALAPTETGAEVLQVLTEPLSGGASDGSGAQGGTASTATGPSGGLGGLAGSIASAATSTGFSLAGAPAGVGTAAGGLVGAAVGKGSVSEADVATATAKGVVAATLGPTVAGVLGIAEGLASMFGVNGPYAALAEALGLTNVTPGFEGGLFGTPGRGGGISATDGGIGASPGEGYGGLGNSLSGAFGVTSTPGVGYGVSIGGLQAAMQDAFPGLQSSPIAAEADPTAEAAAAAFSEAYGGGYGFTDAIGRGGPYGDAPMSGSWGASDNDSSSPSSSDPGPSGTGNSGNAGEG